MSLYKLVLQAAAQSISEPDSFFEQLMVLNSQVQGHLRVPEGLLLEFFEVMEEKGLAQVYEAGIGFLEGGEEWVQRLNGESAEPPKSKKPWHAELKEMCGKAETRYAERMVPPERDFD